MTQRESAYWDLRGLIGEWMETYDQSRDEAIYALSKCVLELQLARDCRQETGMRRLEAFLEEDR